MGVPDVMRWMLAGAVLLGLLAPAQAAAARAKRTTKTTRVSIRITSAACPELPAGTRITGHGTATSAKWTTATRRRRTVARSTIASGTATDQAGNAYTFASSKHFRVARRAGARVYHGTMVSLFRLDGPAPLLNGFDARYRTDFDTIQDLVMLDEFGAPFDEFGLPGCDPL
jgi:hypothetical protein